MSGEFWGYCHYCGGDLKSDKEREGYAIYGGKEYRIPYTHKECLKHAIPLKILARRIEKLEEMIKRMEKEESWK